MDSMFMEMNWLAVIVGAIAAYLLGWLWYSQKLFGKKWLAGTGTPAVPNRSMMPGMLSQAVGTFLLSMLIGVTVTTGSIYTAVLVALTIASLIKAGGFYSGKTKYAITVESTYALAMVAVMVLAHAVV